MQRYDIKKLARRKKPRRRGEQVELPGIQESLGGRSAYLRALRNMLREIKQKAGGARNEFDLDELARVSLGLVTTAQNTVRRILDLENQRHTETFIRTARRALGVDLRSVVLAPDMNDYLRLAAARNAGLIKNLSEDAAQRVSRTVIDAAINGTSNAALQETLTQQFGIVDNRARLIADDQMAKLNSDLNRQRHTQAGITEYTWRTSRDERVRALHRSLDGRVYRYDEPTGAENGERPGQPIRCRCIAQALVTF
jgi:SPP1 gp7 family putative phage head morphogenesis protein